MNENNINDSSISLENVTIDQPTIIANDAQGSISINGEEINRPTLNISDAGLTENVRISYKDENGEEILGLERPQAALNIFDAGYYATSNPDVAVANEGKYQGASLNINLQETRLAQFGLTPIQLTVAGTASVNIVDSTGNNISSVDNNNSLANYTASIEHYIESGVTEGRDPSPLFDNEYYLGQNPDVASALAGGSFEEDPLLHFVSVGANEGRDPNAYFDTSYYIEQNPDVADSGFNPLEHYVLLGSSSGTDPSPNFDPDFYLSQNPDVAATGIDPLIHFLTSGQEEGRLPIAG